MKHTAGPWKFYLKQLAVDPNDSEKGYITKKDYHEIATEQGFYEFKTGEGFAITGYINEANAKLLASAPELKEENERLREAGSNLLQAMNQYSFFVEGYAAGSASISECNHANDELNKAQNVLFELLKTFNPIK